MKCINGQPQSLLTPLISQRKHSLNNTYTLWFANKQAAALKENINRVTYVVPVRTRALQSSEILGASPPAHGDVSVLIQTSAVLLVAYWIANFVVPQIIMKDLTSDENTNVGDQGPDNDERWK